MLEGGYRPHISLAVYDGEAIDVENLRQNLIAYANSTQPFELVLSNLGLFPTEEGVIFLGVTVTQKLMKIHANFIILSNHLPKICDLITG